MSQASANLGNAATVEVLPKLLDVRVIASGLGIEPIELVRLLQDDGVPLLPVSPKRWRVAETDFTAWMQRRKALAAEEAQQRRLRLGHVAGKAGPSSAPTKRRIRFRR
jgi:hypothetical protein